MRTRTTQSLFLSLGLCLTIACSSGSDPSNGNNQADTTQNQDTLFSPDAPSSTDTTMIGDNVGVTDQGQDTTNIIDAPSTPDQTQEPDVPPFSCASAPDGTPCDDENPATVNDACYSGVCSGEMSPEGWHYEFQGGIQGRFTRLRIKQTMDPDVPESWTPWILTKADWSDNYMNSMGPPGFYPAYNIQIINDCSTDLTAETYPNVQLWNWYSIEATFSKDGWLILKNDKGVEEVRLQTFETKWTSYMPEFGNCFSEEALEFEAAKLMLGNPE